VFDVENELFTNIVQLPKEQVLLKIIVEVKVLLGQHPLVAAAQNYVLKTSPTK